MKKVIRLTESDIARLVKETVDEIGYGTLSNAAKEIEWNTPAIGDLDANTGELSGYPFNSSYIINAIETIDEGLRSYASRQKGTLNPQLAAAQQGLEAIRRFFTRKQKQKDNLYSTWDDAQYKYEKEFVDVVKRLYPQAVASSGRVITDELDDEAWNNIMTNLSPKTREYVENEY